MIGLVRWLSRFKRRARLLRWLAQSEGAIPCLIFAFCVTATLGMAAGSAMTFTVVDPTASIVTSNAVRMDPPIIKIQVDWTSDDTTGAVTGTLPYSVVLRPIEQVEPFWIGERDIIKRCGRGRARLGDDAHDLAD